MKIITGILMSIMMFTLSFTQIEAYNSLFIEDDDVNPFYIQDIEIDFYEVNSSGNTFLGHFYTGDEHWHQMSNGYVVYNLDQVNYDFTTMLDDGYYKLSGWEGSPYQYLYMFGLEFNIHDYYYQFEIDWTLGGSTEIVEITWVFNGTNDPNFEIGGNDVDLTLEFYKPEDLYITAYKSNYNLVQSYEEGLEDGYNDGLTDGRNEFGYRDEDTLYSATLWGYMEYQRGLSQGQSDTLALQNMIPGVLGTMIAFFFQMASISVLGVSVLDILVLFFGIGIVLLVFKTFVK